MTSTERNVAIVGTGLIGRAWAAIFARAGWNVRLTDPHVPTLAAAPRLIRDELHALARHGLAADPDGAVARVSVAGSLQEAVMDVEFVQENGPEKVEEKKIIFAELDKLAPPDALLVSSTSAITASRFTEMLPGRARCLVGHPVNPPHLIPLVEIVGGAKTSEQTIGRVAEFYTALGKRTIRLHKEVPGHVANRLQAALWREVVHLVDSGVVSVSDADTAVCWGPGLRWGVMGPNLLFHLGGGAGGIEHFFDQFTGPMTAWWKVLGSPEITPELRKKIVAGVLEEAGTRSLEELAAQRDEDLLGLLAVRART